MTMLVACDDCIAGRWVGYDHPECEVAMMQHMQTHVWLVTAKEKGNPNSRPVTLRVYGDSEEASKYLAALVAQDNPYSQDYDVEQWALHT